MLIGVGIREGGSPVRRLSGAIAAAQNGSTDGACTQTPGGRRGLELSDARVDDVSDKAGIPEGERHPTTWMLPQRAGALSARRRVTGSGAISDANLAAGINIEAALFGSGTISDAALGLILSAVATLSGSGTLSADIVGKLEAAAALTGAGDLTAALGALADLGTTLTGTSSLAAALTALGHISAELTPFTELSPESLATAILDAANAIETGLTPRQALRLITAAVAGKSQAGGTEYRAAVSDSKVRIDATVDGSGNRTEIAYDTDD